MKIILKINRRKKMNEIKKISDEEYFSIDALSNSFLINFDRSPKHYKIGIETTPSMNDGTIAHKYILENQDFWNKYYFMPDTIKSKASKEYKELNAKLEDKELLKYDYKEMLELISDNINNYSLFELDGHKVTMSYILCKSNKEISIFWEDEVNDEIVQKKGRIDIAFETNEYNILFDLKKVENCLDFEYSVKKYKYYRQAAWYADGYAKLTGKKTIFIFLTFEFSKPYGIKAYELNTDYIELGRQENEGSVKKYLMWKSQGSPEIVYPDGIETIYKPSYL
jgi:hypothetical protein